MAQSQLQVIGSGGADAAKVPHPIQGLEEGHHPGDAALGGHLVDDIRLGDTQLGLGGLQIVDHHCHRAEPGEILVHAHARQGMVVGGLHHHGLRLRHCGGTGRPTAPGGGRRNIPAAAAGEGEKYRRQGPCRQEPPPDLHTHSLPFSDHCRVADRVVSCPYHTGRARPRQGRQHKILQRDPVHPAGNVL